MAKISSGKVSPWFLVVVAALLTAVISIGLMKFVDEVPSLGASSEQSQLSYQRIVSLSPAMTETLVALGAADRLAGISDYCATHPALEGKRRVGTGLTPNLEGIVGVQPDSIVVEATSLANYSNLEAMAETKPLAWLTLEEVMASINTLGEMTGHVEEARALTGRIETRLKVDEPKEGPRVLVLIGLSAFEGGSLWYIKRSSLHGAAMHAAGAINAVSDEGSGAPSLSVEALLRIDPDIIITMVSQAELTEADRDAHIERLSRMNMLTAVKNQKLGFLVGEHCMSTGPSILRLADELEAELERLSGDS